jgi:hypothetical protein
MSWKNRNTELMETNLPVVQKGGEKMALEDTLFIILYWTGPVGLGIFFAGLGYLIKCTAIAARKDKESKSVKG